MAFDQTKPAITDNYSTQFTQNIQANNIALAQWFDSANTTITGTVPTYSKRYNRTSKFIDEYNVGTGWGTLLMNISGNAATATTATSATGVLWSGVSSRPTSIAGYGITDAITTGNIGSQSVNYAASAGAIAWSLISSRPTTVSGYGITDAITTANIGSQAVSSATTAGTANALNTSNSYSVAGLTVGNGASSVITMQDTDEGARSIHCNSQRIGFLTQGGGWGAWCDDDGNWGATGNVSAYSDERLKTNWAGLPADFVERLARVKSGTYTRIDTGVRQAGSSAQDWQSLLPEVVQEGSDDAKTLALAYGNAALVSVIELAKRVLELEARLAVLEGCK